MSVPGSQMAGLNATAYVVQSTAIGLDIAENSFVRATGLPGAGAGYLAGRLVGYAGGCV